LLVNTNACQSRQTNCMTRMISRDYHFRYHSAYYIVYHRCLPKTYTKLFSIKGCCFCCCCFQCNFPYLIGGIRAWFAGILVRIGSYILYTTCFKYLGIFFDAGLRWSCDVKYVLRRSIQRMNLLKSVAGISCGAHSSCLILMYRGLIVSVLEYGLVCSVPGIEDCIEADGIYTE
jgi:hypothetical protein